MEGIKNRVVFLGTNGTYLGCVTCLANNACDIANVKDIKVKDQG